MTMRKKCYSHAVPNTTTNPPIPVLCIPPHRQDIRNPPTTHAMFEYAAATPPPNIPIETHINQLIKEGKAVAEALFESHRIRALTGQITDPPTWEIRLHLEAIHDELELCLSALEAQRI